MVGRPLAFTALSLFVIGAAPAAPTPTPRVGWIDGRWSSDCTPIGKNGRHGFIVSVTIRGKSIEATSQTYAHNNCDTPTVRVVYRGRIVLRANGAASTGSDHIVDFDHVAVAVTMTANDPEVVAIYNADNANAGCGFGGGWRLNVPRSIAGRACAPFTFPASGARFYERAWRNGLQLRIGGFPLVWTNTSPDKRPTAPGLTLNYIIS